MFGYTQFDPLVVVGGTLLAVWYLQKAPVKLVSLMPAALSLWFFVPLITNLTLWQTIPMLLAGRLILKGRLFLPRNVQPVTLLLLAVFCLSVGFAIFAGSDTVRVLLRVVYYAGAFATFVFAYELGRRSDSHEALLKGFVVIGIVYAVYGVYQIIAFYADLPVRGIVYNDSGRGIIATQAGLPRINSLANEPKRLGFVLFLSSVACVWLARTYRSRTAKWLRWAAGGIFALSIATFSSSYFLALVLSGLALLFLYPTGLTAKQLLALSVAAVLVLFGFGGEILLAIEENLSSRATEVRLGLDNTVVYRQEIFAWDYVSKNPMTLLTGVGVGQYYYVLRDAYGVGVGINEYGGLVPINSNFVELIFDLGGVATILIYVGLAFVVVRLRLEKQTFYCVTLLFLVFQSLFLLNLLYIGLMAGLALGKLDLNRKFKSAPI